MFLIGVTRSREQYRMTDRATEHVYTCQSTLGACHLVHLGLEWMRRNEECFWISYFLQRWSPQFKDKRHQCTPSRLSFFFAWAVHGVCIGTSPEQHFRKTFFLCSDTDWQSNSKRYTQCLALLLSHLPLEVRHSTLSVWSSLDIFLFDVKNQYWNQIRHCLDRERKTNWYLWC